MAEIRSTPLPRVGSNRAPVQDRVVARVQDYGFQAPGVSSNAGELEGLVRGLSVFNQNLGAFTEGAIRQQEDELKGIAEGEAARVAQQADLTQQSVQEAVAMDLPANVPPAYGKLFKDTLGNLLVDRAASKAKADMVAAYQEASQKEDFDPESFIQEFRSKALGGLTDAPLIGRMGARLGEVEGALRTEAEKARLQRLEDTVNSGLFSAYQETFRADMNPDQIKDVYAQYLPEWRKLGKTSKELASMLLGRLTYLSNAKDGDPSLFDVFDMETDNGQTLLAANPELAPMVTQAREQARARNRAFLEERSQKDNLPVLDALNKDLETNPSAITYERVMSNMGRHGVFPTTEAAASFLARARQAVAERQGDVDLMSAYNMGILGRYDPKDQQKVLEKVWGPRITEAWNEAVNGDPQAARGLAQVVMQAQSMSKATVPVQAVKRLIESVVTSAASPQGPDGTFEAVSELYRGLSADRKFRDLYFSEDQTAVLESYIRDRENGSDPAGAYQKAFAGISPEAKAAAEAFVKTPEFKEKLTGVHKQIQGSSWVPKWMGGNGRAVNQGVVSMAAMEATKQYMTRNPNATPEDAMAYADSWTERNFIMDELSGTAIRVPPQLADETTKAAIAEYSKRVTEAYKLGVRNDADWRIQYRPVGDQGMVQVVIADGAAEQQLGLLPLSTLRQAYVAEQEVSEPERAVLQQMQTQLQAGAVDPAFIDANEAVLQKAKRLGLLKTKELQTIDKTRYDAVKAQLDAVPKFSLGTPSLDSLQHLPKVPLKVDNKLTAQVAKQAFATGSSVPHQSRAMSLITMGEAVMLKAYDDPAKGAGKNIGMGYNLNANAKWVKDDLKRAGVEADKVQAVIDGTAQLTPTQAQRLLALSLPRYEKSAMDAAEKTLPGLWGRMTAGQRAVMIDVAYQTGDPAQFRRAWASLAKGDTEAFQQETKVTYVDRKGVRKEDKRRNDLRAAMLNGDTQWLAVVDKFGGFPSNAVEAFALNQPK